MTSITELMQLVEHGPSDTADEQRIRQLVERHQRHDDAVRQVIAQDRPWTIHTYESAMAGHERRDGEWLPKLVHAVQLNGGPSAGYVVQLDDERWQGRIDGHNRSLPAHDDQDAAALDVASRYVADRLAERGRLLH